MKLPIKTLEYEDNPQPWEFQIPPRALNRSPFKDNRPFIKSLTVERSSQSSANTPGISDDPIFTLMFQTQAMPYNRAMNTSQSDRYLHFNISSLRFPNRRPSDSGDYISKILKAGIRINERSYWFYGHSNSHLNARSCILMSANSAEDVYGIVMAMGNFRAIKTAAKCAKRIGLLFSTAEVGVNLPVAETEDIKDIMSKDGKLEMSDGCGLISYNLSRAIAKKLGIHFESKIYVPNVFQLRYRGYKGVVSTSATLDAQNSKRSQGSPKIQVKFRTSMKKFNASPATGTNFSIVGFSQPYSFGRLNSEVVTLLSSLGVSNEIIKKKQREHFETIINATTDIQSAIILLSSKNLQGVVQTLDHVGGSESRRLRFVEDLAIKGLEDSDVQRKIRHLQEHEMSLAINKRGEEKIRILIPESRRLYGVCDESGVLKEGQVFVRIQVPRKGLVSLVNTDVIIVRNPCLHPGDILKRRAVDPGNNYGLHRAECLVFSGVGMRPDACLSSGGDLDGDEFFVCWDKDLVPTTISESYNYPAPSARREPAVNQERLIDHWARYNVGSLAKVKNLYLKWLRASPNGALAAECQELNALHSDAVDGAPVRIPDRLLEPPSNSNIPFIIDVLVAQAKSFGESWNDQRSLFSQPRLRDVPAQSISEEQLLQLLSSESLALSEYLRFQVMCAYCRQTETDPTQYLPHIDWDALTSNERYAVESIAVRDERYKPGSMLWNSLQQSPILKGHDLGQHHLDGSIHLQRFYSSESDGKLYFFRRLKIAMEYSQRFLLVLKVNPRFTVIIYKCAPVTWGEESPIGNGIRILALTNASGRHASTAVATSSLLTGPRIFQLYSKQIADTFIFLAMSNIQGTEVVQTSIALQKIDTAIQRHLGRVRRESVDAIELHVISNRDRIGRQQLDLAFNFAATEEYIPRLPNVAKELKRDSLQRVNWADYPSNWGSIVRDSKWSLADDLEIKDIHEIILFCVSRHAPHRVIPLMNHILDSRGVELIPFAVSVMDKEVPLLSLLLSNRVVLSPENPEAELLLRSGFKLLKALISITNFVGEAVIWMIQDRFAQIIQAMSVDDTLDIIWTAAISIHVLTLSHLVIQVVAELKTSSSPQPHPSRLTHAVKLATAVCVEHSGQLADELRSDHQHGTPRAKPKQLLISPKVATEWKLSLTYRRDADLRLRKGDHVRIRDVSTDSKFRPDILDCIVTGALEGKALLQAYQVPFPQMSERSWKIHLCGPTATVKAELEAISKLADTEKEDVPQALGDIMCGMSNPSSDAPELVELEAPPDSLNLNESQKNALHAVRAHRLTLIWGPPGTGKTSVVANLLFYLLGALDEDEKILVAASTNNAVDNVVERLLAFPGVNPNLLLRAATDESKVSSSLHHVTVSALEHDTPRGREEAKKALKRIAAARIVFTTCAGAGLGLVRKLEFSVVVVDEASQIVESIALIPLAKGPQRAVLVGDHVQLRPTVTPAAGELKHDQSLFERLYTEYNGPEVAKCMLEIQYRSPAELAAFTSRRFYDNRLSSGLSQEQRRIHKSQFPWPMTRNGQARSHPYPCVFIQCDAIESFGGQSKHNSGQVELARTIIQLLHAAPPSNEATHDQNIPDLQIPRDPPSIALLTPYSKMRVALDALRLPNTTALTVDGAQGREYDYVIFATVRCNADNELGFLKDERRLNVAWTRARYGRIVIGDRMTLEGADDGGALWREALADCEEVDVATFDPK